MKLKPAHKQALITLSAPLDAVLFGSSALALRGIHRNPDGTYSDREGNDRTDEVKRNSALVGGTAVGGTAVAGAAGLIGGKAVKSYANSPGVADRLSGLRSTVPGFAKRSPGMQKTIATVSRAGSDVASAVKTGATAIGKEAMYQGVGLKNAADSALRGLVKGVRGRFRLSARAAQIHELSAMLPEVSEFNVGSGIIGSLVKRPSGPLAQSAAATLPPRLRLPALASFMDPAKRRAAAAGKIRRDEYDGY